MARRRPPQVHGVAVVDKPAGMTSHDVVGLLRRRFGERRVGHAGTLDPDATGVLVVGVGNATRLLRFVTDSRKTYEGEVVFGVETDSLDATGTVTATHDMTGLDVARVRAMIDAHLVGDIDAGAADGVGAQDRRKATARARPAKASRSSAGAAHGDGPSLRVAAPPMIRSCTAIEVDCSSGTYIRTLAADLGAAARRRRAPARISAGQRSARSPSPRPRHRTSASCFRSRRPCGSLPSGDRRRRRRRSGGDRRRAAVVAGRRAVAGRRRPAASCSPSTRHIGRAWPSHR